MSLHRLLASLALVAAFVPRAHADPAADAKPHVERATQLYQEGKTAEALAELEVAYKIQPTPQLLYAIAQAHVVLDHCDRAIEFYEKFLASDPKEQPARLAREAIDHCKQKLAVQAPKEPPQPKDPPQPIATQPAAASPPDAPPASPPPPSPPPDVDAPRSAPRWYAQPVAVGLVGAGAVAGVVSIVLYRGARNDFDAAQTATDYTSHHALIEDGKTGRMSAVLAGAGGLVLVGAGITYAVLKARSPASRIAVTPTSGGGLVAWQGRF